MKTISLSKETQEMLETRVGYRNDSYGVSGVTSLEGVLLHEMLVLGNSDTPEFMKAEYGMDIDISDLNERLQKEVVSEAEAKDILGAIRTEIHSFFGHTDVFCLWLGTRESIEENYHGKEEGMNCYHLTGVNLMPICDLADEGTLFVLDKDPRHLEVTEMEGMDEEEE